MTIDTHTMRRLLAVRELYQRGVELTGRGEETSLIQAVMLLDLAIETTLNLVVQIDPEEREEDTKEGRADMVWATLWRRAAVSASTKSVRLKGSRELRHFHDLRNLVQHIAHAPSHDEVTRYLRPISGFLMQVYRELFGVDFAEFREFDLISSPSFRRILQEARVHLDAGRIVHAVASCLIADFHLLQALLYAAPQPPTAEGEKHRLDGAFLLRRERAELQRFQISAAMRREPIPLNATEDLFIKIGQRLEQFDLAFARVGLGFSMTEVQEYRVASFGVHVTHRQGMRAAPIVQYTYEPSPENASKVLTFCFRTIWAAQMQHPSVVEQVRFDDTLEPD